MAKKKPVRPARRDAVRRLRQTDRLARVLRVLQLIQGRGRWDAAGIAAELECSERTVFRDLQVLEMAGIPWVFDEDARRYRIRPGWQFPVMNLTDDELLGQVTATVVAGAKGLQVGTGARPATSKLAASLSAERQQLLEDAEELVSVLDLKLADHSRSNEIIRTIQWALLDHKQLSGQYGSPYQENPLRLTLHPYRLCLAQQAWYLVARPVDEALPKTYRVTRFKSLRALSTAADVPEQFDLKTYFGNAWGVYRGAETFDVELLFSKDAAPLVTETVWHATQQVRQLADGTATLTFQVDGLEEILWWVLSWSGRVQVIAPRQLKVLVVDQLQQAISMNRK